MVLSGKEAKAKRLDCCFLNFIYRIDWKILKIRHETANNSLVTHDESAVGTLESLVKTRESLLLKPQAPLSQVQDERQDHSMILPSDSGSSICCSVAYCIRLDIFL